MLAFVNNKISLPSLQAWQQLLAIAVLVIILQNTLQFGFLLQARAFLDRLLFVLWTVIFLQELRKNRDFLGTMAYGLLVPTCVLTSIGLCQVYGMSFQSIPIGSDAKAALFGNNNYIAEYLAYVCILFLFALKREKQVYRKFIFEFASAASLAYIIHLNCRAIFIGLACALIYMIFFIRLLPNMAILRMSLLSLFFYFLPNLVSHKEKKAAISGPVTHLIAKGTASIRERVFIWEDLLSTSFSNPAGIGSGNFSFGHISASLGNAKSEIREFFFWQHPHNEWLRLLVEDGWLFTVCLSVLYFSLVYGAWRKVRVAKRQGTLTKETQSKWQILLSLGIILLASGACSFPLYLSFSFLIAALLTALLCELQAEPLTLKVKKILIIVLALLLNLAFLNLASRVDFAEYVSKKRLHSEIDTDSACRQVPNHWQVCVAAINNHIVRRNFREAELKLSAILERAPLHYPALKMQAFLAEQKANRFDECLSLWLYDSILKNASSLTTHKNEICPADLLQEFSRSFSSGLPAKVMRSKNKNAKN